MIFLGPVGTEKKTRDWNFYLVLNVLRVIRYLKSNEKFSLAWLKSSAQFSFLCKQVTSLILAELPWALFLSLRVRLLGMS